MMKIISILLLTALLTGCTTSTQYGECKGLINQEEKEKDLKYTVDGMNIFWAFIFSETLVVPLGVGAFWIWCPTGKK